MTTETRTTGMDVLVESELPLASMSPLDNLISQVQGNGASVPPFPPIYQTINQVQGNGASVPQFPPTNQNVTQVQGNGALVPQFPRTHHTSASPAFNENGTYTPFDLFRHVTARPKTNKLAEGSFLQRNHWALLVM